MVAGPSAADPTDYGITFDNIQHLSKDIDNYTELVRKPQQSIADAAGQRSQLRRFIIQMSSLLVVPR